LLWISVALLFLLVGLVAALMFRAFIAPLRVQLSASQELVERQEKLASLGVLAAGVAHEIRNPLTAIKFRLFSLKKALPPELEDNEDVATIHNEVNRLERIVKDFLQFARPSEPELADVAVEELLQATQFLLREELGKRGIQLQIEGQPAGRLRADRQQMRQVLINLIQNAAESIERPGGTITLRAREGAARLRDGSEPVVMIEVTDTGNGIPPGAEQRIFDPFFSTKENGSGLGLPIAARIVEKHGGSIHYVTQPNRGTTFSIVLPRVKADESPNPAH
jgi:signal transduction histidine kinase